MRILILGGTLFLGRHLVEAALAQGHFVAVFNRGRTQTCLPPAVLQLRGDRNADVSALRGEHYDVVIDTSAYHPRHVENVVAALGHRGHYILISTASVYAEFPADETTPVHPPLWDRALVPGPATYAGLKRACEEIALREFGHRLTIVRPGLLAGPYDPTNRLEYWVRRCARGGQILAPGDPERRIQLLDVRDLASWLLQTAGHALGVFNAAGPREPLTIGELITLCIAVTRGDAQPVWVPDDFVLAHDVIPWSELPLWIPQAAGTALEVDWSRAAQAGLHPRPTSDTIRDVFEAGSSRGTLAGGLSPAMPIGANREEELLRIWNHDRTA